MVSPLRCACSWRAWSASHSACSSRALTSESTAAASAGDCNGGAEVEAAAENSPAVCGSAAVVAPARGEEGAEGARGGSGLCPWLAEEAPFDNGKGAPSTASCTASTDTLGPHRRFAVSMSWKSCGKWFGQATTSHAGDASPLSEGGAVSNRRRAASASGAVSSTEAVTTSAVAEGGNAIAAA